MKNNIFLEQPRRGYTREAQLTPYKAGGRGVGLITVILLVLSVFVTACNKPEKKELVGTWQWYCTSGGIAGVNYTPESEGFEAKLVFKGSHFTFYKDGKKITSGTYRVDYKVDETLYNKKGDIDDTFYSWFNLNIPEAQCKKISEATNGIIAPFPKSFAVISYDDRYDPQVLSMSDNCYDGFTYTFVKAII